MRERERDLAERISGKQRDDKFHRRQPPFVLLSAILTGLALSGEQRKTQRGKD